MAYGKWQYLNIWPDSIIALQREIPKHPKLVALLNNHAVADWEVRLAEVANYCEIVLDGDYLPEDIEKLAGILEKRLIERREDNRGLLILV